jgi:diguanylate cyclase (GGDEF)-like protein
MEWLGQTSLRPQIDHELNKPWRGGVFSAQLEEKFQDRNQTLDRKHNETAALACMVLFDAFAMSDLRLAPDIAWLSLVLRFALFNPVILLIIVAGRVGVNRRLYKTIISSTPILATLVTGILLDTARSPGIIADCYAIPMVVLFANLLMRTGMPYSLISTLLSVAVYVPMVALAPGVPVQQIPVLMLTEVSVAALSLLSVFYLEQRERQVFLLLLRERLQAEELSLENHELKTLSHTDALSGISNRRHFDAVLPEAWAHAVGDEQPMALLMFDIDHFKSYNDRYGHPAGDLCLRRVAFMAHQQLRWDTDLLARYGGEEFVVILPGANAEMVAQIAERIRSGVESLHIAHAGVGTDAVITVSIGAVSIKPDSVQNPHQMVEVADAELYAAKQAGRNRVFIRSGKNRICIKRSARRLEKGTVRQTDDPASSHQTTDSVESNLHPV